MVRGLVYDEKYTLNDTELLRQLNEAYVELERTMKASKPVGQGFGVDKVQRGIAADAVISIAKAIKALRGW